MTDPNQPGICTWACAGDVAARAAAKMATPPNKAAREIFTRIVQLLVERVTVGENGIAVDLRQEGLGSVLRDMMAPRQTEACA